MASVKCWLGGLLVAWVVQIFGTSMLVAIGWHDAVTLSAIWAVADDVAPFAKISFILILALLVAPLRQRELPWPADIVWWAGASIAAVLLVLALLPQHLSRGFGIGLTGSRFDPSLLPSYLIAGFLAGCAGALLRRRCRLTGTAAH